MSELFGFSRLIAALLLCLLLGGAHASAHSSNRREAPREEPREEAREEACVGITEACAGALLAVGRNPETAGEIGAFLLETGEKLRALRLRRCDRHHVAEAHGRIAAAWTEAFGRNPSAGDKLKEVVRLCVTALSEARGER